MNQIHVLAPDSEEETDKQEKCKGYLSMLDIKHVTICYFLLDFYNILAKAQHGVCKINQLPWEYDD